MKKIIIFLILPLVLLGSDPEDDPIMPLSVAEQIPLLLKILSYDKSQNGRTDDFVLGVVYQERYRYSLSTMNAVLEETKETHSFEGRPFRVVPIRLEDAQDLSAKLRANSVTAVYVAPVRAFDIENIALVTREERLLSVTGVPDYLGLGLSVSLRAEKSKPVIVINSTASTAEGANFHSQLLKLARIQG